MQLRSIFIVACKNSCTYFYILSTIPIFVLLSALPRATPLLPLSAEHFLRRIKSGSFFLQFHWVLPHGWFRWERNVTGRSVEAANSATSIHKSAIASPSTTSSSLLWYGGSDMTPLHCAMLSTRFEGKGTTLPGHPICVHAVRRKSNRNDCTKISVSRSLGPIWHVGI